MTRKSSEAEQRQEDKAAKNLHQHRQSARPLHTRATPRPADSGEDEWFVVSRFAVRVMERFFATVDADSRFPLMTEIDLYSVYLDVLSEELRPYTSDLALQLFSHEDVSLAALRRVLEEGEEASKHETDGA